MLEEYYKENYTRLVKTVVSRLDYNFAVAEEVVQESFSRALQFIESFDEEVQSFGGWFNTILNNCVRDAKKQEKSRGMSLDSVEDTLPNAEHDPILNITKEEISSSISMMKDGVTKEVLNLYFNIGMLPRHICQVLNISSNGYVRFIISNWRKTIMEKYK